MNKTTSMKVYKQIIDNRTHKNSLEYHLKQVLKKSKVFRIVSAYFTINGFKLLERELKRMGEVRFLFGDRGSVGETIPVDQQHKFFKFTENGLIPNESLNQNQLANRCAEWVKNESVYIRSIEESKFLHGKMYLSESDEHTTAVVGSSNLTQSGLSASSNSNIEINLATDNHSICTELISWFDEIWSDETLTKDIKNEVLSELGRIGRNLSPEFVYFKTLFEMFDDKLKAHQESEEKFEKTHLFDTKIWNSLYTFQQHGALEIISRLTNNNGCILADSVGLGKTFTALAVIKYFELTNDSGVLVLCPKKLRNNWTLYPAYNHYSSNPFAVDRFSFTVLSHTDLTRESGLVGDINLEDFNWSKFGLIVIDESHNFRNFSSSSLEENETKKRHTRYSRLLDEVIGSGIPTKVLMLSATPVNTSLMDLRNQIYLMTEGKTDTFKESLGISNLDSLMAQAQKFFKTWETEASASGRKDKNDLLENLGAEFIGLLSEVSISRSKSQIQKFYKTDMSRIGSFPKHNDPVSRAPNTDAENKLSYEELVAEIEKFNLSLYTPSKYVTDENATSKFEDEWGFKQQDREHYLVGMMKTNFLKRLESSVDSLRKTLDRTIKKISLLLDEINKFESNYSTSKKMIVELVEDEDSDDFLIETKSYSIHFSEIDLQVWKIDLEGDLNVLLKVMDRLKTITPERDGKLIQLKKEIVERMSTPNKNDAEISNQKILLFTSFKDTAVYLYDNLQELGNQLDINISLVAGDLTRTGVGMNTFNEILDRFAPLARGNNHPVHEQIDLLIATDCISEGQNLQDCDTVLNFDIHWNPTRVIQRFGRIDRIGSKHKFVNMINYWPTEDMEVYLKLHSRVHARMALADVTASGDSDLLNEQDSEESVQTEISFREDQLKLMKEKVLDLDDLSENVVLSDFTMDKFVAQLMNYLEKNREELEKTPNGVFAISNKSDMEGYRGIIFVLRQRNSAKSQISRKASALHPYYCVYIRYDGNVRIGCTQAKQVMELFETLAVGNSSPLNKLCDEFDTEIDYGRSMSKYDELLNRAIISIQRKFMRTQMKGFGVGQSRDFKLPKYSETPNSPEDFELISWIVMR